MIKTRQHILSVSLEDAEALRQCQMESARCWNEILNTATVFRTFSGGTWIGKNELQKTLKGSFGLHSQTIQALTDKYIANRETAAELRRQGLTNIRYPWREKKYLTIPFKQMAIRRSSAGSIILTLSAGVHFDTGIVPKVPVHTAEILWRKGRYVLSYTGEFTEAEPRMGGLRAGIDLGEIHPVALCDETGIGIVISGREIRATKQLRNKALSDLQKKISRCKKGSRQIRKYLKAKRRIMAKTENQVRDLVHQATRKAIDYCVDNGITELVIGNPEGVEKNTRRDKRLSRKCAQKVSQMEYGRLKKYLAYKAKEQGIATCLENERDTSKECPNCGKRNHVRGRIYRCSRCGFLAHRDGKAGFMILRKKHRDISTPETFEIRHKQAVPKYRKRLLVKSNDGLRSRPRRGPSCSAIAEPLGGALSAS